MDEIEIVPYDQGWPALYEAAQARLLPVLDSYGLISAAPLRRDFQRSPSSTSRSP
jgi:hypothetical protein